MSDEALRMAIDPDGNVKPVNRFTAGEKWWCDCGDASGPHVHCEMHVHAVDLVTGRSTENGGRGIADAPREAEEHEHGFPVQPPHGTIVSPGPCACGKTWAVCQAERQLAAALAALTVARREAGDGA